MIIKTVLSTANKMCKGISVIIVVIQLLDIYVDQYIEHLNFGLLYCSWHGCAVLSESSFLIHGGYNGNNALSDAFIFNTGES